MTMIHPPPHPDPVPGFCRDCLAPARAEARRCHACGSPRLIRHAEIDTLTLAHVDCDAFYATVEKRDNPELADKPVIIGGGKRGVVSTCCYIARIHGVRSAMPMFKALDACPEAIVIRPDMEKYARVGREVRMMMEELTPLVQPISIDEAFLDLAGTEKLHKDTPARTGLAALFAARIEAEIASRCRSGCPIANSRQGGPPISRQDPRGFGDRQTGGAVVSWRHGR